ncbi:glycosyltransferase [Pseudoduganella sp. LjRoot289]|uniref:glycosyltransferase family 2 protein n=1 Tax=Pseudoduganella sp. LjRoot289 TaxID=3342314 RepID=UPI003ECF325E
MNSPSAPLVSVVVSVYNHEKYLLKTLEGVEMQQGVDFEIIIHDDCSPDGSAEICRQFAARSRHRVKLILQAENKMGRNIGIWSEIYSQCEGEYVAICEGDDFWTHPGKLAHQCQSLAMLPHVDLAFHKVARIHWQSEGVTGYLGDYGEEPRLFSVNQVIEGDGGFIPTPSIMIRRSLLKAMPDWYYEHLPAGDYCLQVYGALRGGALYLPLCGAAYRQGDPTSWSQQTTADIQKVNRFDQAFLLFMGRLRASLPTNCHASVDQLTLQRFLLYCQRCFVHNKLGDVAELATALERSRSSI